MEERTLEEKKNLALTTKKSWLRDMLTKELEEEEWEKDLQKKN